MADRTFDWVPRHDPRSRAYPVRTAARLPASKRWTPGLVTDQGEEGACVGHGWVAEALATPVRVRFDRLAAARLPHVPDRVAQAVYHRAQVLDQWAGEDYEGTSVNAGALAMRELGVVREWRWAFGETDMPAALQHGPVVIGIPWHEGMYDAPGGVVTVTGPQVGGHCILVTGYATHPALGPAYQWRNSWGHTYGVGGSAWIARTDLAGLLRQDGEAAVVTRRSYGH